MSFQGEAFTYILKQYLKGKKDNINLILISIRELILEKIEYHQLSQDEIKILLKFVIQGIDTYSFEKAMSFNDYLNLYIDISINSYKETKNLIQLDFKEDDFTKVFIENLIETIKQSKRKDFKLN